MAASRPTRPGIIVPALRRSLIGLVFGVLASAPVLAENVPLPIPAPLPKTGGARTTSPAAPVPPAPVPNANAPDDSHQSSIFPFSLPFGRNSSNSSSSSDQASNFDAKQRSLLDRISMYLSSIQTMEGHFVQIGPDGGRTEGNFYIQKPGRVRFAYDPPSPIDIIADGSTVVVRDRKLATQDLYPLSQTPLRYLLADRIDLLHDTDVVSVSSDETFATVVS